MSASRNDVTGGVLANVKGAADKYATGYDLIVWDEKPSAPEILTQGDEPLTPPEP